MYGEQVVLGVELAQNQKNISRAKPKVSYLQYEIMELVYEHRLDEVNEVTGYKKGSLTLKNAFNALIAKGLINEDLTLTDAGISLLMSHYEDRHLHKEYEVSALELNNPLPLNVASEQSVSRWYKYLEDFPVYFVEDTLKKYKISGKYYVLDPFLGSATTSIEAKKLGYKSIGLDINPAMTFIAEAKLNWELDIDVISKEYSKIIKSFSTRKNKLGGVQGTPLENMPTKELNQWLSPVKQKELGELYRLISKITKAEYGNIFMLALIRASINSSYVAFCPGTTFYPFRKKQDLIIEFKDSMQQIIDDLQTDKRVNDSKGVEAEVLVGSILDSESVRKYKNEVDLIITSPPYPNDLEYTRQTRLEMYLLGVVNSMNDVQKIKRSMVKGSTKLIFNTDKPSDHVLKSKTINDIVEAVRDKVKGKEWGFDYPKMLSMYFSDMYVTLKNCYDVLIEGGTAVFVVGDQTVQGVLVPVAEVLKGLAEDIGFSSSTIELHRHRRSTEHDLEIPEENLILKK